MFCVPGPVDLSFCMQVATTDGFEKLKYPSWVPPNPPEYNSQQSIFTTLARRNLLIVHPY